MKHLVILMVIGIVLGITTGSVAAQVATAQTSVSGKVLDTRSNQPLEGANVILLGTGFGASTDSSGSFLIPGVQAGKQVLVVSFVGYASERRTVELLEGQTTFVSVGLDPIILPGQTIVVTATRAHERQTPAPFATVTARDLAERYSTQDVPQLLSELPSTTWYSENGNGIGYNYLSIRGFDQRRISVMINGIPQNDPEDHNIYWLDFPDLAANLEDIQVQRGAGSAFYGPPAIGGSVNLVTGFSHQSSIDFSSGYGTFNTRKNSVAVNSGLVGNRYIFYGRLSRMTSDGYRDRSWTDFSSYYLGAVRYDESMTTQFNFYGGPIADHLAYYGIPKSDAYSSNADVRRQNPIARPEEIENFSQPHYELLHEWKINDRLTLNNALFYVTGAGFFDYDGSWAPYSYYRITPQNGFSVTGDPDTLFIPDALIRAYVDNRQVGWLPRLRLDHSNGVLTVGAELRAHRSLHWGALNWGQDLPIGVTPDYHYYEYRGAKDVISLYGRESYHLNPAVTVLASLQYVYNRYRLYDEKYVGTDFTVPYHFLNPRIGVNYNLSEHFQVYGNISRTSREPRLKNLYDAAEASTPASWGPVTPQFEVRPGGGYDFSSPLVKPESLVGLELGGGYVEDRVKLGVNLYSMDFHDEIVKSGRLDRFGQPVTGNADRTLHQGIELTAAAGPFAHFTLQGNLSLSRNRLSKYTVYVSGSPVSLDGNTIAGFPSVLGNLRISFEDDGVQAAFLVQHVGESYTDNFQNPGKATPDPNRTLDAYTVVNAWLNYTLPTSFIGQSLEIRLQVNNLFDKIYASHGEGSDFFPAAGRNGFASLRFRL